MRLFRIFFQFDCMECLNSTHSSAHKDCFIRLHIFFFVWQGKALELASIGRGYGKRITFESDSCCHNDNYFYSDTNTSGYGFRLHAIEEGQKFTLRDSADHAVGFCTISQIKVSFQSRIARQPVNEFYYDKSAGNCAHYLQKSNCIPVYFSRTKWKSSKR